MITIIHEVNPHPHVHGDRLGITIIHETDANVTVTEIEESPYRRGYTKTIYTVSEIEDFNSLKAKLAGIHRSGTNAFLYLFASQSLESSRILRYTEVVEWLDEMWADIVDANEDLEEEECSDQKNERQTGSA